MEGCHLCSVFGSDIRLETASFSARCCKKRCNKSYCIDCIKSKFDSNFQEEVYKPDTWICYSCQSLCSCLLCKGIGSEKKTYKKKTITTPKKQQQCSSNEKGNGADDYFSEEDMRVAAPFMRRIMQRKNQMYRVLADEPEKDKQKSTKKLKKIINDTLRNYEDDDELDIELID